MTFLFEYQSTCLYYQNFLNLDCILGYISLLESAYILPQCISHMQTQPLHECYSHTGPLVHKACMAFLIKAWSEDLLGGKCLVNTKTLYCGFQLQFRQLREHFKFCHGFVLICMIYITYFPLLPVADCFPIEFLVSCSHDCFYCTLKLLTYHAGSCMHVYLFLFRA